MRTCTNVRTNQRREAIFRNRNPCVYHAYHVAIPIHRVSPLFRTRYSAGMKREGREREGELVRVRGLIILLWQRGINGASGSSPWTATKHSRRWLPVNCGCLALRRTTDPGKFLAFCPLPSPDHSSPPLCTLHIARRNGRRDNHRDIASVGRRTWGQETFLPIFIRLPLPALRDLIPRQFPRSSFGVLRTLLLVATVLSLDDCYHFSIAIRVRCSVS